MEELTEAEQDLFDQIDELVRSYSWMKKEVERLQTIIYGGAISMKSWGVAQYGVDATLPKGSSGKSQSELKEMDVKEERQYKRLKQYETQVYAIEMAGDLLKAEKDKVIFDCLLDGMSYRAIGQQLGINKDQVKTTRRGIIIQLSQNRQFSSLLHSKK